MLDQVRSGYFRYCQVMTG